MGDSRTDFYGDVQLARIQPMLPNWHVWYIYHGDSSITWHCHRSESMTPVLHSDSPDGLVCRVHEYQLTMDR